MTWFVYLLVCQGGSLYTSVATDVERRFAQHLAGKGARYTRAFPPERLLVSWTCASRRVALQLEYAIKRLPLDRKLALARGEPVALCLPLQLIAGIWLELK